MGVVNVTPDSFSDGGTFDDDAAAIRHARRLVEEGAAIVDVGGESTRPGAAPVPAEEELRRVVGVVEGIAGLGLDARISVDTMKAEVARAAVDGGRHLRQRRDRVPARPRDGRAGRRARARLLPDAHARGAAHDAAGPALRRRRLRRQGLPGGAPCGRRRRRGARGARAAGPGDRLRQDARAQPRAAAAARRDRGDRPPGRARHLAQVVHRPPHRPRRRGPRARDRRHLRARLRARGPGVPRARRRRGARRPRGGGCYVAAGCPEDPDPYEDEDEELSAAATTRTTRVPRSGSPSRSSGSPSIRTTA